MRLRRHKAKQKRRGRLKRQKRDMDLIRSILLTVEGDPSLTGPTAKHYGASDFPGYTDSDVRYHVELLVEAGFLQAHSSHTAGPRDWVSRLTWQGHEFIAATKDEDIWHKVKSRAKVVTEVALPLLTELAKDEMKKKLGL
jgi:Hypothetical protein (DUF2513)